MAVSVPCEGDLATLYSEGRQVRSVRIGGSSCLVDVINQNLGHTGQSGKRPAGKYKRRTTWAGHKSIQQGRVQVPFMSQCSQKGAGQKDSVSWVVRCSRDGGLVHFESAAISVDLWRMGSRHSKRQGDVAERRSSNLRISWHWVGGWTS